MKRKGVPERRPEALWKKGKLRKKRQKKKADRTHKMPLLRGKGTKKSTYLAKERTEKRIC